MRPWGKAAGLVSAEALLKVSRAEEATAGEHERTAHRAAPWGEAARPVASASK